MSKFLFLPLSGLLKISERKQETIKRVICHEGIYKLENLFKPFVTNTFISFGESSQLKSQGWTPFSNMSDACLKF